MRNFTLTVLIFSTFGTWTFSAEFQTAFIESTRRVEVLDSDVTGRLYPWNGPECAKGMHHDQQCWITNGCGFAEAVHRVSRLNGAEADTEITVLHSLGEWCDIGAIAANDARIVVFYEHEGVNYVIESHKGIDSTDGGIFIAADEYADYENAPQSMSFTARDYECWKTCDLDESDLKWLKARPDVSAVAGSYCPSSGIPLDRLERWYATTDFDLSAF